MRPAPAPIDLGSDSPLRTVALDIEAAPGDRVAVTARCLYCAWRAKVIGDDSGEIAASLAPIVTAHRAHQHHL